MIPVPFPGFPWLLLFHFLMGYPVCQACGSRAIIECCFTRLLCTQVSRMNLLETESYSDVVAKGRRRKRPKLASGVTDLSSLIATVEVRYRCRERLEACAMY